MLTLTGWCSYAQVTAGFNTSPSSGCAPLVVSFTNTTSPAPGTSYVWDMDNGTGPITLRDPSTSYFSPGTYTVTLTATNGSSSSIARKLITVNPSPVVSFSASDTVGCPGTTVTFSSSSSAGVSGPVTYLWSSGDGYTSTSSGYTHQYFLPGYFNVSLSVTNSAGCTSLLTKPAYIHVWPPPVPTFSVTARQICPNGGPIRFTPSVTGVGPFIYKWVFGDGSTSTSVGPDHSYTAPGIYTVKLIVTDSRGCTDSISVPNYIKVSPLNAAFSGPDSACMNTLVNFTNTSTTYLNSKWSYGDGGGFTNSINGSHTYTRRGPYMVTLIVADSFCSDTFSRNFIVPEPKISFKITPDSPCPAPVLATFKAVVPGGSSVWWNFGDGSTGTGVITTHTYAHDKFDTVMMVATSAMGCKDTVVDTYKIYNLEFSFRFSGGFIKGGCVPITLPFSVSLNTSTPDPLFTVPYPYGGTFVWNFGDGSPPASGPAQMHAYTLVGVFPVSCTLTTGNGCTRTIYDTMKAGTKPKAEFTATPRHLCYNRNNVFFTRTLLAGPVDSVIYNWRFGEGVYGYDLWDEVKQPIYTIPHHFTVPDTLSDTLIAYYNWCPDTFIRKDYVIIDSPVANPGPVRVTCPFTATFSNLSLGADSCLWFFADSTTSTAYSPTHTFPRAGIYKNKLTVYNIRSGCRDTAEVMVDLTKPKVTILASDTAICRGDTVMFTANKISGITQFYRWELHGGEPSDIFADFFTPSVQSRYFSTGRYTVKLFVYDQNMCVDSVIKNNYILVAKPNVNFRTTPPAPCWPQITTFADSSTDQPGVTFSSYRWAFGDGSTAITSSASIPHSYTATGTYAVKEIVTDNVGCKDSVTLTRSFFDSKAGFFAVSQTCANTNVSFSNISSVGTYLWSFGDGGTSTLTNPTHAFRGSGVYTVTLIVTESHGCKDTATRTISVAKPNASFYMDDSVSVCPPFAVHFHNTSTGGVSNFWILGDGNTSIATHPSNLYTVPGYDTVQLIVTNAAGCRDTAIGHVKVYGYAGAFSYNADSGCVPLRISFDADLSNIALAASIIWDFSDGVVSSASLTDTISHAYVVPGAYLPKLIITDHAGCVSSSLGRDTIKADRVDAGFLAIPDPVCLNDTIRMTDTSRGFWAHINKWHWDHNGDTSNLQSPYFVFSGVGSHTVSLTATDAWGCVGSAHQVVSVYSLPGITSLPDSSICVGNTTDLNNGIPGGSWSSGNMLIATVGSATGIVAGIASGIAVITYSLSEVCYVTMPVTVNAYPFAGYITGDTALCIGDTVLLSDSVAGGMWYVGGNKISIDGTGSVRGIAAGSDTVYYLVANATCWDTTNKPVVVYPSPDSGVISGKHIICVDAVTTLTETVSGGIWKSGDSAIVKIDTATGKVIGISLGSTVITYNIADINGCGSQTTFPIRVAEADFNLTASVEDVKCYGGTDGSIAVSIEGGTPPFEYRWSVDSTTPGISGLDTGLYTIDVRSLDNQCRLHKEYEVKQPDSVVVNPVAENDICYRGKGSVITNVTGGVGPYSYLWSNKGTTADIKGLVAGVYNVTVTDANGCFKFYSVVIADICADILIRTGVSPNGDGANDTWIIEGIEKFPANNVKLFDKWGDKIYEKDGYNNEWYGEGPNGSLLPDGTYYYLVKLNSEYIASGKDVYTGAVLIKR